MVDVEKFGTHILNTLTEQISVINKDGDIVYVNESWIKFNENNAGSTKGNAWNDVNYLKVSDNSANSGDSIALQASQGIRSVISNKEKVFYLEYPCHSPSEERWFMMRVTSFELDEKKYYVLSHQNITERKLAENELSDNLIELKKTQDMMLRQERYATKGEMLSLIAHHWRQPLSAISAKIINIELASTFQDFDLEKKEEAIQYQEFVNKSLSESTVILQELSSVVDNFQIFHNSDKSKEFVTLQEVCDMALNILHTSLDENKVEIVVDCKSNEKFNLIVGEVVQVIYYIIQNSQEKFYNKKTNKPQVKITINKDEILICDNGGAIPMDIIDRIFEPYFSTKEELSGKGLGLYMSKTIIEEHHNGKIQIYNQDSGVCCKITLN